MANVLNQKVAPIINKAIAKPSFKRELANFFSSFLNKNRDKFTDIGPVTNIYFPKEYHETLFKIFEVDEKLVAQCMNESSDIFVNNDREQTVKPYNLMLAVAIKCLHDKNMKPERSMVTFLLYMSFFGSTYTKYFKYNPNRQIMEYTINNMSMRYDIKKKGYFKTLQDSAEGVYVNIESRLNNATDSTYQYIVTDSKTRLNSLINNIFGEFKANHEKGNFLNMADDNLDEDNYHIAETDSLQIRNIVNNVTTKIYSETPNIKLLQYACKIAGVSVNETRNIIYLTQKNIKIRGSVELVVEGTVNNFIIDNKQKISNIHSNNFMVMSLLFFKRSSSVESNIKRVKDNIDIILENGMDCKNTKTSTLSSFKRAVFIYIVLMIQQIV